jgi:hypothetical protein
MKIIRQQTLPLNACILQVQRLWTIGAVVAGAILLGAGSANAYSTSMSSPQAGQVLGIGDPVEIVIEFDTEGAADIMLLSVSVLFDTGIMDFTGSSAPTQALYFGPVPGWVGLQPAGTNGYLRVGTINQVNMDWLSTDFPNGNTEPGSFQMATLNFTISALGDGNAEFTLSNSRSGNVLWLSSGSYPPNSLSGDFAVSTIPEPSTALLVVMGLVGLGMAPRRRL